MPIPIEPGQPQRYDYEYERAGTANNFMVTEPLGGWRKVNVRPTKTALDLAQIGPVQNSVCEPLVEISPRA